MRKHRPRIGLIAAAALLLAACDPPPGLVGDEAPRLVSSEPADGATGVGRDQALTLVFSSPMDPGSLELAVAPPVALGPVAFPQPTRAVVTPNGGWPAGTAVTVTVLAEDTEGRPLAGGTRVRFTVASPAPDDDGPPAAPSGVLATAGEGRFELTWSANAEPDLAGYQLLWGPAGGAAEGALFVAAPATSAEVEGLANGVTYSYRLHAEDEAGNRSAPATGTVMPVDATPPTIESTVPADGATGLERAPLLRLTFSEAIDRGSLELVACRLDELGGECQEAVEGFLLSEARWTGGDHTVEYDSAWPPDTAVRVTVTAADLAGNQLSGDAEVEFALAEPVDETPPEVLLFSAATSPITRTMRIVYEFSEAMDQASFAAAFRSQPALACDWVWNDPDWTYCDVGFAQNTVYTLTLSPEAADVAGNHLQVPHSTTVTTPDLPPQLTTVTPRVGAMNAGVAAQITFVFDEPVDVASLALEVVAGTTPVSGSVVSLDEVTLEFTPDPGYGSGALVTWAIGSLTDTAGTPIIQPLTGWFRTRLVVGPATTGGDR